MASRASEEASQVAKGLRDENVHGHDTRKPTLEIMPEKEIPCFKADSFADSPKLLKEFDRQLKSQNEGLNELTVEQYLKNRDAYLNPITRRQLENKRGQVARQAREEYMKEIDSDAREQFSKNNSLEDAKMLAQKQTKEEMNYIAALHEPDLVAGGYNEIGGFGSRSINSSIGSQWVKKPANTIMTRVQIMDNYVRTVPQEKWVTTKLNMKMERCK